MGRNCPSAKTKTVLKTACKATQLRKMQNLTNPFFWNKNHPNVLHFSAVCDSDIVGTCVSSLAAPEKWPTPVP